MTKTKDMFDEQFIDIYGNVCKAIPKQELEWDDDSKDEEIASDLIDAFLNDNPTIKSNYNAQHKPLF